MLRGTLDLGTFNRVRKKPKIKVIMSLLIAGILLVTFGGFKLFGKSRMEATYDQAVADYNKGRICYDPSLLEDAREGFNEVGSYKESEKYIADIDELLDKIQKYENAAALEEGGNTPGAMEAFHALGDFRSSDMRADGIASLIYEKATESYTNDELDQADNLIKKIPDWASAFVDGAELSKKISLRRNELEKNAKDQETYDLGVAAENEGDLLTAQKYFLQIPRYKDSSSHIFTVGEDIYIKAETAYKAEKYEEALNWLSNIITKEQWTGFSKAVQLKAEVEKAQPEPIPDPNPDPDSNPDPNPNPDPDPDPTPVTPGSIRYLDELTSCDSEGRHWTKLEMENNIYGDEGDGNKVHLHVLRGTGWRKYHLDGAYKAIPGPLFIQADARATVDEPVRLILMDINGTVFYDERIYSGMKSIHFEVTLPETAQDEIYIDFYGAYTSYKPDWIGGIGEIGFIYK